MKELRFSLGREDVANYADQLSLCGRQARCTPSTTTKCLPSEKALPASELV